MQKKKFGGVYLVPGGGILSPRGYVCPGGVPARVGMGGVCPGGLPGQVLPLLTEWQTSVKI